MAKARTLVGLDVHAAKIVAAMLDAETGELRFQRLAGESGPVVESLRARLPAPVRATYEAGPTGYGLARALDRAGVECVVAAPGKIPRGGERPGQDRPPRRRAPGAAAAGPASCTRSGCPGRAEEALRDLVRAREDVRGDLMRARHRLSKLLLRHGMRYRGQGAGASATATGWPSVELGEARRAGDAAGLPRRDRGAAASPRRARAPDRGASSPARPGRGRSGGCAACAASTRSRRSGCAPRSATSPASRAPGS